MRKGLIFGCEVLFLEKENLMYAKIVLNFVQSLTNENKVITSLTALHRNVTLTRVLRGLVIYPLSGNNATLKIDFTDPGKRNFVCNLLYLLDTGSEMIHLLE